ncbi:MAG: hypothetical protein M3Y56_14650, partial [Armatimonadota bacterium]|nr:hypothetical protein [Armatimonadota bacterium]
MFKSWLVTLPIVILVLLSPWQGVSAQDARAKTATPPVVPRPRTANIPSPEADAAFNEGDRLSELQTLAGYKGAIESYLKAAATYAKAGKKNEQALSLDDTHRILGETARQNATEAVLVSGQTGAGFDRLLELVDQELSQDP